MLGNLTDLEFLFKNQSIHIVGKGPSLDRLTEDDIDFHDPVIAINDAIYQCEAKLANPSLFWIQQDAAIGILRPKLADGIISIHAAEGYDSNNNYIYNPEDFNCITETISVCVAIHIAKLCQATRIILHCFDACKNQNTRYAKCIGYEPERWGNDSDRFLQHCKMIQEAALGIDLHWF